MQSIRNFFLLCSGAYVPLLKRAPSEMNKYAGIGGTIFFTGLLAALSGGFALWTVFREPWAAVLFGLAWGLMIFNLDRYIVASMKKRDNTWAEIRMAIPRIILAILIATVISKPLELQIFNKEIKAELIIMEQEKLKTQEDKVKLRFQGRIDSLQVQVGKLKAELQERTTHRDSLLLLAQQEADGTGGSRVKNLGPIYKAKKADADSATASLKLLSDRNTKLIDTLEKEIAMGQTKIDSTINNLQRESMDGFANRLDALGKLTEASTPMWFANWFIILLFIALETAPVFVKLISPRGPYDDLLEQHEYSFIIHKDERKTRLKRDSDRRLEKDEKDYKG
ncbi:uncharacterized protein DUF4407 [Chitinophaga skermanii]|uniref:Uncharacterized protein DUF4407 n=1 Tax=Chitinophaga skermanii TaxID=331697 RepID=A0A327Q624_9BACT|nr:DUF4407 domain-containing protein [Chitinophaga skermanii]RAI99424.1 uncharacterized protein DUF4407 [Chitinophaga skermanii]